MDFYDMTDEDNNNLMLAADNVRYNSANKLPDVELVLKALTSFRKQTKDLRQRIAAYENEQKITDQTAEKIIKYAEASFNQNKNDVEIPESEALDKVCTWGQSVFVDKRQYHKMSKEWKEQQQYLESCTVSPDHGLGTILCRSSFPEEAKWIAENLNYAYAKKEEDRKLIEAITKGEELTDRDVADILKPSFDLLDKAKKEKQ